MFFPWKRENLLAVFPFYSGYSLGNIMSETLLHRRICSLPIHNYSEAHNGNRNASVRPKNTSAFHRWKSRVHVSMSMSSFIRKTKVGVIFFPCQPRKAMYARGCAYKFVYFVRISFIIL